MMIDPYKQLSHEIYYSFMNILVLEVSPEKSITKKILLENSLPKRNCFRGECGSPVQH